MLESGTDPESYITEYTLVYKDMIDLGLLGGLGSGPFLLRYLGAIQNRERRQQSARLLARVSV